MTHLPTSAINLAYSKVSLVFCIFAIASNVPKQTKRKIIMKKNLIIYEGET